MYFLNCMLYIWRHEKISCKTGEWITPLLWYLWLFINSESVFILWSPFFSKKLCFLCFPYLLPITESISLDTFDKSTSGITSLCSTIWEDIDDASSFIALAATSGCIISDEMFFNNSINITFKWCIIPRNNFFVPIPQTFYLTDLISLFLSVTLCLSLSLLGFESFASFHLVSEFLVVSYSLTAFCECWLPCVK